MNQSDLAVLQNFSALWARVTGEQAAACSGTAQEDTVLQCLYDCHGMCAGMAKCSAGTAHKCLSCMENELRRMIRTLQAGRFLVRGDLYQPAESGKICKLSPMNLQKLWRNTMSARKALDGADLGDFPLSPGERECFSRQLDCHSRQLRDLLQQLL